MEAQRLLAARSHVANQAAVSGARGVGRSATKDDYEVVGHALGQRFVPNPGRGNEGHVFQGLGKALKCRSDQGRRFQSRWHFQRILKIIVSLKIGHVNEGKEKVAAGTE